MIVPLLAGAAKTLVISMLSERVVLRVLLMLAEWASAKSTTTIDDKIVTEIRTKLEADQSFYSDSSKKINLLDSSANSGTINFPFKEF